MSDLVLQSQNAQLENIDAGRVVLRITQISGDCNFRLPPDFTMIAKTLLNLDQVVHTLDPKFDPNFAIRNYANVIMQRRMQKALSAGNLYGTVLELKDFAQKFPSRINQLVDTLTNRGIKIEVDAIDERSLLASLHKIANRITIGLLLAALIVGAALMMRVETSFKILGYPGIAIIFFLLEEVAQNIGAWGWAHVLPDVEDVVYAKMGFKSGPTAHVHVSWLDPVKVRQITIVGSDAMLVFDDVQPSEKVRVYQKRFRPQIDGDSYADFQSAYHHGDVHIPAISSSEPLKLEVLDFVNAIMTGERPRADGVHGLRVVEALEAASACLRLKHKHRSNGKDQRMFRRRNIPAGGREVAVA